MSYFLTVFIIGLVILVHELGHFLAARRVGIPVRIFSVGFGPRVWGLQKGGTEYRISLIPLGGYVLPDIEDEKDYFEIPVNKRIIMSAGGPAANIVLAILCIACVNVAVHGFTFSVVLLMPVYQAFMLLYQMLAVIPMLFSQPDQLSGVVGIVAQGGQFIGMDYLRGLQFLALISLNLALINLLPIPALDGGKIMLYVLEKIHPGFLRLHFPLSAVGWFLILGLMIYVTVADVARVL